MQYSYQPPMLASPSLAALLAPVACQSLLYGLAVYWWFVPHKMANIWYARWNS